MPDKKGNLREPQAKLGRKSAESGCGRPLSRAYPYRPISTAIVPAAIATP